MKAWPQHLNEIGYSDPQTRRLGAAEALATRWAKNAAATSRRHRRLHRRRRSHARLMQAVLEAAERPHRLPRHRSRSRRTRAGPASHDAASHPQNTLGATLNWLGLKPQDVQPWPVEAETQRERARRRLINEALAPAIETRDWNERLAALAAPSPAARPGDRSACRASRLSRPKTKAKRPSSPPCCCARRSRRPGKTAALVTPEASLARRIAAILERWGIDIAPSAGIPLSRTAPGSLLLILARWIAKPADPVLLLAVLKHECVLLGRDPDTYRAIISAMERATLRDPPRSPTLEALAERLATLRIPAARSREADHATSTSSTISPTRPSPTS